MNLGKAYQACQEIELLTKQTTNLFTITLLLFALPATRSLFEALLI